MSNFLDAFRVDGQVALVTGGANGIGRATAEVLAEAGATVIVADVDVSGAKEVAAGIGGSAVALDVSDRLAVDAVVDAVMAEHGRLDIVCNVAGVWAERGHVVDIDEAELDRVVGVNLKGTFFCCQAAIRAMAPAGRGSIVNVASSIIDMPIAGNALYAMTKAGTTMLTRILADEVGPLGLRVNVVAPGFTITEFAQHSVADEDGHVDPAEWESYLERLRGMTPLGEVCDPIDQALLILYLVSPAAARATGNVFRVNAGMARPT
jgi:3-oxoacyl-[acyl-carrier protein] reductase